MMLIRRVTQRMMLLLLSPVFLFLIARPNTAYGADGGGGGEGDAATESTVRPRSQYNKTQQDKMLEMLEKWRSQVSPKADPNSMKKLEWNEELASLAQAQADRCTYEPGYPDWSESLSILSSHPGRRIGFTHWTGWNSSWATNYWNAEGNWYDYCENRCTYDRDELKAQGFYRSSVVYYFRGCVNYTQVIWADSKNVGCGHRVCGFKDFHFQPGNDHHVCFFFPGAIIEYPESERMKNLPYETLQPLAVACGVESTTRWIIASWTSFTTVSVVSSTSFVWLMSRGIL